MKKLLVLVLSIMFVAGAFTSAYAAHGEALANLEGSKVILGGDMRVRGVCKINHDTIEDIDDDNCYWDQRVRLTVTGQIGDAEVRTRFTTATNTDAVSQHNAKWDGAEETGGSLNVDYAYLHVPVAGIVIDAGRQKATFGNSFYQDDVAKDRFKISAKVGDATIGAYTDKMSENSNGNEGFLSNDVDDYGIYADYSAGDINGGVLVVFSNDDQVDDNDGTDATAYVNTKVGNVGLKGELSLKTGDRYEYLDANTLDTVDDTQWGGFVSADMGMDAVTVGGVVAFTANGYVADKHFQPTAMVGSNQPAAVMNFGAAPSVVQMAAEAILPGATVTVDTLLAALNVGYQATPELSVYGRGAYMDFADSTVTANGVGATADDVDASAWEIDAGLKYQISKGVTYSVDLGYLIPDNITGVDDNMLSITNQFTVNFN
ncbi:MAG: hypothetical protein HZC48_00310 [Nitrospirae bacterium]|nr:hypothetical protein [Nitrospirota bacterium]